MLKEPIWHLPDSNIFFIRIIRFMPRFWFFSYLIIRAFVYLYENILKRPKFNLDLLERVSCRYFKDL